MAYIRTAHTETAASRKADALWIKDHAEVRTEAKTVTYRATVMDLTPSRH